MRGGCATRPVSIWAPVFSCRSGSTHQERAPLPGLPIQSGEGSSTKKELPIPTRANSDVYSANPLAAAPCRADQGIAGHNSDLNKIGAQPDRKTAAIGEAEHLGDR